MSKKRCRRPDLVKLHMCHHEFLPFELINWGSPFLSWGNFHCPIPLFLKYSPSANMDTLLRAHHYQM